MVDKQAPNLTPLAYRIRPKSFEEFIGQQKVVGENSPLLASLRSGKSQSLIMYGPPGSGKTTLAYLIKDTLGAEFYQLSAVDSGVKDVRKYIEKARKNLSEGKITILFIDEIHRFNKAQQDSLLHAVEAGEIVLIGATTENPFFEVITPLLSRCLLVVLEPLSDEDLRKIIRRAVEHPDGFGGKIRVEDQAEEKIIQFASGDARRALNILENAALMAEGENRQTISANDVVKVIESTVHYYDKSGDYHYDFISAFIKSLRASDPDAALAYMLRMIEGGEDPKFIARRMIIFASEDIGNADPLALLIANAAFDAVERVGLPECVINLSHAVTYLATCPKSNNSYIAMKKAYEDVKKFPAITIPEKLRDSSYRGAKKLGRGKGYRYPHDYPGHFYPESLMPEELKGKIYYKPEEIGYEKKIKERLEKIRKLIKEAEGRKERD